MIHFLGNSEHILQCRLLIKTEVFIVIWVLKIFNNNDAKIYVELFPPIWPQVSDNLVKQFLRFQKDICQLSKIIKEKKNQKFYVHFKQNWNEVTLVRQSFRAVSIGRIQQELPGGCINIKHSCNFYQSRKIGINCWSCHWPAEWAWDWSLFNLRRSRAANEFFSELIFGRVSIFGFLILLNY